MILNIQNDYLKWWIKYVCFSDVSLSIVNNSVSCSDEYQGTDFVIVLKRFQNGRLVKEAQVPGNHTAYLPLKQNTFFSTEVFQCTSYLDRNRSAVSTQRTLVYRFTGKVMLPYDLCASFMRRKTYFSFWYLFHILLCFLSLSSPHLSNFTLFNSYQICLPIIGWQ